MLGEGTISHPPPHSVRSTYPGYVADLKRRIDGARLSAANWWACTGTSGKPFREQQRRRVWGEAVVDRLARDLKASFARTAGFSAASLWRMRQFHETYTTPEFLAQLVREGRRDTPRPPGIQSAGGRQPVRTRTGCARNGRGRAMGPPCQPAGRL
ncbi:DUF1016 N-terminal domain-containing protein [Variovorax paradoxus]|uniref:DUF1016 N-terminal domain-containing protein n=1 Tax=Variovorax paradoxus TaxID=34073 RepID=UPI003520F366